LKIDQHAIASSWRISVRRLLGRQSSSLISESRQGRPFPHPDSDNRYAGHGSILCLLSVSIQGEKQRAECAPKGTAQRAFSSLPKNHYRHIL